MMRGCRPALLLLAFAAAAGTAPRPARGGELSVREILKLLPERPEGFGRPISDRRAWAAPAAWPAFRERIRKAEQLLKEPLRPSPDALFLDYKKTGNRQRWEQVAWRRRGRIWLFALAECLENKGRFLAGYKQALRAVCAEKTWVMPAHDASLRNFRGQVVEIDLGASQLGYQIALSAWLLGDRLDARTRKLLQKNLQRRIFTPFLEMVTGRRAPMWWCNAKSNWNAVCLSGVAGAALAALASRKQRARIVAAAVRFSRNYLKGFTPDGYCSEGLGYWNYGFGHFAILSEALFRATGGRIDLLASPGARAPSTFPERIEIVDGVCPAFADCPVKIRPTPWLVYYLHRAPGPPDPEDLAEAAQAPLAAALMLAFPGPAHPAAFARAAPEEASGLRSYFPDAGVLICRTASGDFGAACKGGHNAENHNHNDVGSYVLVTGGRAVLVDPGAEVYTARTFSARRYKSRLLNSYGHDVPVLGGNLQLAGRAAAAKVLKAAFTAKTDTFELDLAAAYRTKGLQALRRTFRFHRTEPPSLVVRDEVAYEHPATFETALITFGTWRRAGRNTLLVRDGDAGVRIDVDTGGLPFEVEAKTIEEQARAPSRPTRIAIRFVGRIKRGFIRLSIEPEP